MPRLSYSRAGVDLARVRGIHRSLAEALGPTFANRAGLKGAPMIPIGHYAGLIDLGGKDALALHTDGVGTKVLVAQKLGRFDTVGIDCVAMTVNDLICLGAEPVALLDYIALQREDPLLVRELGKGLVEGARLAGASIVGGETAVLGDVIKGEGRGFDMASMGVGLVAKDSVVDGRRIEAGDALLGDESSGLHYNGYTLARKILAQKDFGESVPGSGSTIGESLLTPTRIYVKPALSALKGGEVHGIGHITGGAFSKLPRLVGGRGLRFDLDLPPPSPIFGFIQSEGGLSDAEMYKTFNMGVGLVLAVPESESRKAARPFEKEGFRTHLVGAVGKGKGVSVNGTRIV